MEVTFQFPEDKLGRRWMRLALPRLLRFWVSWGLVISLVASGLALSKPVLELDGPLALFLGWLAIVSICIVCFRIIYVPLLDINPRLLNLPITFRLHSEFVETESSLFRERFPWVMVAAIHTHRGSVMFETRVMKTLVVPPWAFENQESQAMFVQAAQQFHSQARPLSQWMAPLVDAEATESHVANTNPMSVAEQTIRFIFPRSEFINIWKRGLCMTRDTTVGSRIFRNVAGTILGASLFIIVTVAMVSGMVVGGLSVFSLVVALLFGTLVFTVGGLVYRTVLEIFFRRHLAEEAFIDRAITISAQGVLMDCRVYQVWHSWNLVSRIVMAERYVLFYSHDTKVTFLIPTRAFSNQAAAQDFVITACQLQQRAVLPDQPNASVVDTGNPYQPPQIY